MSKTEIILSRIVSTIISVGLFFVGLFVLVGFFQVFIRIIAVLILIAAFTNIRNSFKK